MRRAPFFSRVSVFALVVALVGCTSHPGDAETVASAEPSAAPVSSPPPTEEAPAFPTEAFADISEDPVSRKEAAGFQAILTDMASLNGTGMSATVMTANGTHGAGRRVQRTAFETFGSTASSASRASPSR